MTNVERFKQLVALREGNVDHQYVAAFYILSSGPDLFSAAQKAVSSDGIDFRTIRKEVQKTASENKQLLCEIANNVFSWDSACRENPFWSLATLPARDYLLAWEAIGIAGGKLELRVQMGRFDISEEPLAKAIAFENQIDAMREKAFAGMEP